MKKLSALLLSAAIIAGTILPSVSWTYAKSELTEQTITYANTEVIASSDKLLYGYLTNSVKKSKVKIKGDANKALYDILLDHVKDIAAGKKSSTEITVSADDIGLADKSWSKSELGITDLDEAWSKIAPLIGFDQRNLLNALVSNCPYDLYWLNKRKGLNINRRTSSNYEMTSIKISNLTFKFYVDSSYQAGNNEFIVDSAKLTRVNTARENANKIVAKYADYDDYTRLKDYKQEICDLVSYDTAAAAQSDPTDGDPWQLINVFDGDENTKVVCEGYAKAFKYLCDLSTFSSDQIDCILVSGNMSSNGSGGAHMWNIVTMDDGKNYLVDVTNCDAGSIGEGDYLFLVGDTLKTGSPDNGYTIKFTRPGYYPSSITYTYDDDTLSSYKDDDDGDTNLTLNTSNYEPASQSHTHTYGTPTFSWSSDYSKATANFKCTSDDYTKSVNAEVTYNTTKEATEDAEGEVKYTATVTFNGKDYSDTKTKTLPKLAHTHSYGEPTFNWTGNSATASFTCVKDDDTQTVNATVTSKTTKQATENAEGETEYTATATFNGKDYTDTKTKSLPKLAHTHTYGDPTFNWTGNSATATFTCVKGDDTQTVDATVTSKTTKEATEDAEGEVKYTATVTFNGNEYSETKTVLIPRLEKKTNETSTGTTTQGGSTTSSGDTDATVTGTTAQGDGTTSSMNTGTVTGNSTTNETSTGTSAQDGSTTTSVNAGAAVKAKSTTKKTVKLSQVKIKSVKNQKGRKIKVTFKKVKKAKKYQISYRLKGKKWVTKTVSKTSLIIKKLKKKKKYFIRVRAVNGKSYGKWSKTKTILIRK